MSKEALIAVAAGVVLFVVGLIVASYRANKKRLEALSSLFAQLGDTHWPRPDSEQRQEAYVAVGSPRVLKNGARGVRWAVRTRSQGDGAWMLEHAYTVRAGNHNQTVVHVVASVPVPASWKSWGELRVSRETIGSRLAAMLGRKDITLDDANFNREFRVQAENEDFALLLLTPQVQQWLLQLPREWSFEVGGGALRVLHRGTATVQIAAQLISAPRAFLSRVTPDLLHDAPVASV